MPNRLGCSVRAGWHAAALILLAALAAAATSAVRAAEPVRIGFSMPLTGGLASNGKAILTAYQMWAEDINTKGGLLGRKVELVFYDDQSNPTQVAGIYAKLLDVDKVDLVISSYGTNMSMPAMPVVMPKNLVLMSLFARAVNKQFNYPNYFSMFPAGAGRGARNLARLLRDRQGTETADGCYRRRAPEGLNPSIGQ
jgi:branched-chain amino acid transport system substrate-binding protein